MLLQKMPAVQQFRETLRHLKNKEIDIGSSSGSKAEVKVGEFNKYDYSPAMLEIEDLNNDLKDQP